MAIASEVLNVHAGPVAVPCYQGNRVVVARLGHYLLKSQRLTSEATADYPDYHL
jgi:LysR family cys regulon transcriptional activator